MAMRSPIEEQLRPVTFEEYRALPDDGPRYELINGELFLMPAPKAIHRFVIGNLFKIINEFVTRHQLGLILFAPFDLRLSEHTSVQPDLLYFSKENKRAIGPDYAIRPPNLAIEVLSPSNRRTDLVLKRALFADHGVPEYWIVDPNKRSVSVNLLQNGRYDETVFMRGSVDVHVLPGLTLDLASVFELPAWMPPFLTQHEDANSDDK
jgi:Uma2 family endonuclease